MKASRGRQRKPLVPATFLRSKWQTHHQRRSHPNERFGQDHRKRVLHRRRRSPSIPVKPSGETRTKTRAKRRNRLPVHPPYLNFNRVKKVIIVATSRARLSYVRQLGEHAPCVQQKCGAAAHAPRLRPSEFTRVAAPEITKLASGAASAARAAVQASAASAGTTHSGIQRFSTIPSEIAATG